MSLTKDNWILSPELLKLVKVSRDLFGRFCLALPCLVLAILQIKYKKQLIYLDLLLDYIRLVLALTMFSGEPGLFGVTGSS